MKSPKRKAPEKKAARSSSGLFYGAGAAVLGAAAARPGLTGGVVVFTIIFGMISANALWYQPGGHPSPLLRTRDAGDQHLLIGFQRNDAPSDVTTYRIERAPPAPAPSDVNDVLRNAGSDLVLGIQQELVRLGHYQGQADGKAGPLTSAAIMAFEKSAGLPETGEATDRLLALLKTAGVPVPATPSPAKAEEKPAPQIAVIPAARPSIVPARAKAADPVAEAILKAQKVTPLAPVPNVSIPVKAQPASATPAEADAALVMKIQRGLSKFAYSHVTVDGVAGETTREAIRNFERAYRLPETGEPNERVLKKLRDIGAL